MGPDYSYYKGYFDYFYGIKENTNLEQGLIYFYFSSLFLSLKSEYINQLNYLEIVSHSIQLANSVFYLLGLIGLYVFLRKKNFQTKIVLIVLILLNFFPPLVELIQSAMVIFPKFFYFC